jgi:hypothetical protein
MSKVAKLVAISLAISQGSALPRNKSKKMTMKGKEYFKEMNKQLSNSKNAQIRQAINVLKRINKSNRKTKRSK